MNNAIVLVIICIIVVSTTLSYLLGRYQNKLVDKIRTLEEQRREPTIEPSVTMGSYMKPKPVSTASDDKATGIAEPKTPERVAWETEQAIEAEGLGHKIGPS